MTDQVRQPTLDRFKAELHSLLDETFHTVHGQYLDKQTSLFETLAAISAEEASGRWEAAARRWRRR